jgi:hypothetical protein
LQEYRPTPENASEESFSEVLLDTMSGNDFQLNLQEYRPTPENASEESFSEVLLDTMSGNDF